MDKKDYYNSQNWKKLRSNILLKEPICQNCKLFLRDTPSQTVHHILKFYDQPDEKTKTDLLLDPDNLIALCSDCHQNIHTKDPWKIHPSLKQYIFDVKNYLCYKWPNAKWTEDANRRIL